MNHNIERTTFQFFSEESQEDAEKEEDRAVTDIAEHDTEQEGERDTRENCWIYFFVDGNTVSVDNFLESPCEFIVPEESWWFDCVLIVLSVLSSWESGQCVED